MRYQILFIIFIVLAGGACGRKPEAAGKNAGEERQLQLPKIPEEIEDPDERLSYLLIHYWDRMPWEDREAMADTAFVDQTTVNYLDLLARADSIRASEAYRAMLAKAPEAGAFRIDSITEQYLFNPESPLYSPGLFLVVVDANIAMPAKARINRDRLVSLKQDLMKNRPGHPAADFNISLREGGSATLSAIAAQQEETLLIFYDTDCNVCKDAMKRIEENENIRQRMEEGILRIVAVDAFGSPQEEWERQAAEMPKGWTVGRAPEVDEEELYLLKATPTIYVVGKDMKVIAQDIRL